MDKIDYFSTCTYPQSFSLGWNIKDGRSGSFNQTQSFLSSIEAVCLKVLTADDRTFMWSKRTIPEISNSFNPFSVSNRLGGGKPKINQ